MLFRVRAYFVARPADRQAGKQKGGQGAPLCPGKVGIGEVVFMALEGGAQTKAAIVTVTHPCVSFRGSGWLLCFAYHSTNRHRHQDGVIF